jgi:prophage tail gpP-like protein
VASVPRGTIGIVGKSFVAKNHSDVVFTGKVEAIDFQLSRQEKTFQIAGRDLGDLLDSDYVQGPFQWIGTQDFLSIAQHIAKPFGVHVFSEKKLPVKNFTVKKGDNIAEILRRGATESQSLFFATPEGALKFASFQPKNSSLSVSEKDILTLSISQDHTKTFATYATASQVFQNSKDSQRTIFLRNKSPPEWAAQRHQDRMQSITLTLPRLPAIALGETIKLSTSLVSGDFLIAGITWQMSPQEGPTTTLKLRAHGKIENHKP